MNIPEGFVLVPADPIKAIDMGWAYLDAARDAEPGRDWAFSHSGYRAMIAAAPSPADSTCRTDGRCEYAIQSGAEGNGHCPNGKCAMPASAPSDLVTARMTTKDRIEWMSKHDVDLWTDWMGDPSIKSHNVDEWMTENGVPTHKSSAPQLSAHLTIPGALEWDGDNGTHGVVGTHSADGESDYDDAKEACAEIERTGAPGDVIREINDELVDLRAQLDDYKSKWLAKCEALKILGIHARHAEKLVKSFREKLEVDSVGKGFIEALDGFIGALGRDDNTHCESGEAKPSCEACGDWGHIETEDSAHDCPECGPSVIERAVEAGVMNAPAKPKACIECDQPYCHGVCVERGDQDYDRDQAAKGGEQ